MKSGMASSSMFSSISTVLPPLSPEISISLSKSPGLLPSLSAKMESGGEGHQMTLVADGDPYRVALGLPFEAFMPPDVFPFPREPRFATG